MLVSRCANYIYALLLMVPLAVFAAEPSQVDGLKQSVYKTIELLKDPTFNTVEKRVERRDQLRRLIYDQFDFTTMSQGAVGPKWHSFTATQQQRFIELFRQLLESSYLGKIENYQGETVEFAREIMENQNIIRVESIVHHKNQDYHLSYRLLNGSSGWRVFDIAIEGVSLINNYRAQFQQILGSSTVDGLLEKLAQKAATIDNIGNKP
ncbi:MAG: ABC transporter substrate-binding protein [Magnetococcales bacterium]|nr:ABC transporter substrate-binding protein [Magnetococcales bacterium]